MLPYGALLRRMAHPMERWGRALGSAAPVLVARRARLRVEGHAAGQVPPLCAHRRDAVDQASPDTNARPLRPHESVAPSPHAPRMTHEKTPRPHRPVPASGDARKTRQEGRQPARRPMRTFRSSRSTRGLIRPEKVAGPEYVARNRPECTAARPKRVPSPLPHRLHLNESEPTQSPGR